MQKSAGLYQTTGLYQTNHVPYEVGVTLLFVCIGDFGNVLDQERIDNIYEVLSEGQQAFLVQG